MNRMPLISYFQMQEVALEVAFWVTFFEVVHVEVTRWCGPGLLSHRDSDRGPQVGRRRGCPCLYSCLETRLTCPQLEPPLQGVLLLWVDTNRLPSGGCRAPCGIGLTRLWCLPRRLHPSPGPGRTRL